MIADLRTCHAKQALACGTIDCGRNHRKLLERYRAHQLPGPTLYSNASKNVHNKRQAPISRTYARTQVDQSETGNHQRPDKQLGFAYLPGVDSPSQLQAYWSSKARPRLEALYRAASGVKPVPRLLPIVDQLLWELKQVAAPAHHCSTRHSDPAWRHAASIVASSCDKYEEYIYRSQGLYNKVCHVRDKLTATCQKLEAAAQTPNKQQDSTSGPANNGTTGIDVWSEGLTDEYCRHVTPQQLLRLATILCLTFEKKGVGVEDGISHLLSPHSSSTLDTAWMEVAEWQQKERRIAQRISTVTRDVRIAPVLALQDITLQPHDHERASSPANSLSSPAVTVQDANLGAQGMDGLQPWWSEDELLLKLINRTPQLSTTDDDESTQQQPATKTLQLSTETEGSIDAVSSDSNDQLAHSKEGYNQCSSASWSDAILLDRFATQLLLRKHPNNSVRQAVFEQGVMRRMSVMLQLCSQQAACRARIAELHGEPSYAHVMQAPGVCATGAPADILQALKHVAQAAEQPAHRMAQAMSGLPQGSAHLEQSTSQPGRNSEAIDTDQPMGAGMRPQPILPQDVAYLQQQLQSSVVLDLQYDDVKDFMFLPAIMKGLSEVLNDIMGVTLQLAWQPTTWSSNTATTNNNMGRQTTITLAERGLSTGMPDTGMEEGNSATLQQQVHPAEIWSDQQLVIHVHSINSLPPNPSTDRCHAQGTTDPIADTMDTSRQQGLLLGIIYLDPGTGYGTRQLRFTRCWNQPSTCYNTFDSASTSGHSELADNVPVVSIGLQQSWRDGYAGTLKALWELLHEMGHALHLIMSSEGCLFKHWAGLHLPLDVLEVPSMFLEKLCMHPGTLRRVCQHSCFLPPQDRSTLMPEEMATRLASQFNAMHYNAIDFQDQVLIALFDQLIAMSTRPGHDSATECYALVWETFSAIPHVPATLKRLSTLPVACHHPVMYWCYITAFMVASTLWDRQLEAHHVSREQSQTICRELFSANAESDPALLLQKLVETESGLLGGSNGAAWYQQLGLSTSLQKWLWTAV